MELYRAWRDRREVRQLSLYRDHRDRDRDLPDHCAFLPAPEHRVQLHAEILCGVSLPANVGAALRGHSLYHHAARI